jgi:hypothetical protein
MLYMITSGKEYSLNEQTVREFMQFSAMFCNFCNFLQFLDYPRPSYKAYKNDKFFVGKKDSPNP